jgi:hypothetical protein
MGFTIGSRGKVPGKRVKREEEIVISSQKSKAK